MFDPQQVKIVFFDIDETLYIKHQQKLPASVPIALAKLKQKGILPAIATGRSLCALPKQINELMASLPIELLVTINGQYNSYRGQPLQTYPLAITDIERLIRLFKQHDIDYAFVSECAIAVNRVTSNIEQAMNPITEDYIVDADYYLKYPVYQMLPFYEQQQDRLILESGVLQQHLRVLRWHEFSVDLLPTEGSKARGINAVLQHFGWQPQNAVAFGDGLNDLEMLSEVGFGVAMGNGHPELKAQADYVTADIADDGLALGLQYLGLID